MLLVAFHFRCSNFLPLRDSDTNKEEAHSQFLTANGTPIKNVMEKPISKLISGLETRQQPFSHVRLNNPF